MILCRNGALGTSGYFVIRPGYAILSNRDKYERQIVSARPGGDYA